MIEATEARPVGTASSVYSPCCPLRGKVPRTLPAPAFILAGGSGSRLGMLTASRPKPVVPFAGHHRIIDFTLSNCANSGVRDVTLLTQYLAEPILDYVGDGRAWGFTGHGGRLRGLRPPPGALYDGTADAVRQTMPRRWDPGTRAVLVLAADHVYGMDYAPLVERHLRTGADITLSVVEVTRDEARRFGVVHVAPDGSAVAFEEKPADPRSTLVSMGIYVFDPHRLRQLLTIDAAEPTSHDFGHDIVPLALALGLNVQTYRFSGYWRDVGTPESYWSTHRELLMGTADEALDGVLAATCAGARGALVFGDQAVARESSILGGSTIEGTVERSVLSAGVYVGRGAIVRDSVVLPGARIEEGAIVDHAILDEYCAIDAFASVGIARGPRAISAVPGVRPIAVVSAGARVPPRSVVPRGGVVPHADVVVERRSSYVA